MTVVSRLFYGPDDDYFTVYMRPEEIYKRIREAEGRGETFIKFSNTERRDNIHGQRGYDGIECREDTCVAISSIYLISGFVLKPNANPEKV